MPKEAKIKETKAIIKASKAQKTCTAVGKGFVKTIEEEEENKISFSKVDREVKYLHNRPLYAIVIINGMEAQRAFIDNGAYINIMPYNVFKQLGLSEKKIIKDKISITSFANKSTRTLGHIRLICKWERFEDLGCSMWQKLIQHTMCWCGENGRMTLKWYRQSSINA